MLGACAPGAPVRQSGGDLGSQPLTITSLITTTEFRFQPTHLRVRADVPVRLTFDNRLQPGNSGGALAHDFTIDKISGRGLLSRLAGFRVHIAVAANSQATGEFQLPAGNDDFYCSVDRHALDGMTGTVIVGE
jgi:plastocyanin